ncbi:DUF397 domain-containing protein [Nocardia sp. NPDC052566]|uniref:DUF397 domain-containing protein n=1 Tax=Nocardia sp. NPDC052566 TaxID=3364330 RepID=UPI0037CA573C
MNSRDRLTWRTSSHSGTNGGQCVEVAFDVEAGIVLIRDTKFQRNPSNIPENQPVIEMLDAEWDAFLESATSSTAETRHAVPSIERQPSGEVIIRGADGTTLTFTDEEWSAFVAGVRDSEFAPV